MSTNEDIDYGEITEALNNKADRDLNNLPNSASVPYHVSVENNLQEQIDALSAKGDIADIVGTYTDLTNYDKTKLSNNDIIQVLQDSTHDNATSYYKYVSSSNNFTYVGSTSATYTKTESDNRYVHLTGNEDISGVKTFLSTPILSINDTSSRYVSKDLGYQQGTVPSESRWSGILMVDKNDVEMGTFFTSYRSDGTVRSSMNVSAPIAGSTSKNAIYISCDANGNFTTGAPTPASATDDSTQIATTKHVINVLKAIWPVGSVYIGTQNTCPMSAFFGTWTLVSSGKALWTGDGTNANTTISAGLPNITGTQQLVINSTAQASSGAFSVSGSNVDADLKTAETTTGTRFWAKKISFNAKNSNSIYGNSSTVQPPAYVVNVWRRTA